MNVKYILINVNKGATLKGKGDHYILGWSIYIAVLSIILVGQVKVIDAVSINFIIQT